MTKLPLIGLNLMHKSSMRSSYGNISKGYVHPKRCWETAASVARAVAMSPDMDGYDIDEIIKHIDEYAV